MSCYFRSAMESSSVFSFLLGMPKGAALHMHDFSLASADWVIAEITYRDNLYVCIPEDIDNQVPL